MAQCSMMIPVAPHPALRRDTFVELRAQAISCIDKSRLFS
jgi:hypothetical protein